MSEAALSGVRAESQCGERERHEDTVCEEEMHELHERGRSESDVRESDHDLTQEQSAQCVEWLRELTRSAGQTSAREVEQETRRGEREQRVKRAKLEERMGVRMKVGDEAGTESLRREERVAEGGDGTRHSDEQQTDVSGYDLGELPTREWSASATLASPVRDDHDGVDERERIAEMRRHEIGTRHRGIVGDEAQLHEDSAEEPLGHDEHEPDDAPTSRCVSVGEESPRSDHESDSEDTAERGRDAVEELDGELTRAALRNDDPAAQRPVVAASVAREAHADIGAPDDHEDGVGQVRVHSRAKPSHVGSLFDHGPQVSPADVAAQAQRVSRDGSSRETPVTWNHVRKLERTEAKRRTALASLIAATANAIEGTPSPRPLRVAHRDVVPAALLRRIIGSLSNSDLLVDAATNEVVGIVHVDSGAGSVSTLSVDARAVSDVNPMVHDLVTILHPGLIVTPVTRPSEVPLGAEFAFFEIECGGTTARAYLSATALREVSAKGAAELTAHLDVVVSLEVGRTRLDASSCRSLEYGDVVTLDVHYGGYIAASARGTTEPWWLERRDGTLLRVRAPQNAGSLMSTPMNPQSNSPSLVATTDDQALISMDDLVVDLSVEIAQLATTVAELSSLGVGAVLVSDIPLGRDVVLKNHGRIVARGELVQVDGNVAVRITALAAQ